MAREPIGNQGLHPYWGLPILAVIAWHGLNISRSLAPDYLLSMCYLANVILAAGIMSRSDLLVGVGFGWALIALPLWAINSWVTGKLMLSSLAFHVTGVGIGFLALKRTVLPTWLVLVAVPLGIFSCLLARAFTHPQYNVNAAFRVQQGWESVFPDLGVSLFAQLMAYSMVFLVIPVVNNRRAFSRDADKT